MALALKQIFVKPAPGCMIRDPLTRRFLKAEGEWKPETTYWLRRVRMVDVIKCDPPKSKAEKQKRRSSSRDSSNASDRTDSTKKDEDSQ